MFQVWNLNLEFEVIKKGHQNIDGL